MKVSEKTLVRIGFVEALESVGIEDRPTIDQLMKILTEPSMQELSSRIANERRNGNSKSIKENVLLILDHYNKA